MLQTAAVTKCLPGLGCTVGKLMLPSWCITQMPIPVSAGTFQPRHTWAKQWISHQLCSRLNLHWNHGIDPCDQKPRYLNKPTRSNFSYDLADIPRPWRSLLVTTEPVLRDKIHGVAATPWINWPLEMFSSILRKCPTVKWLLLVTQEQGLKLREVFTSGTKAPRARCWQQGGGSTIAAAEASASFKTLFYWHFVTDINFYLRWNLLVNAQNFFSCSVKARRETHSIC